MMKYIFWISLFFILYTYFGYPLLLKFLSLIRNRKVKKQPITPPVTFIITAHNEIKNIVQKLEGTLALDYPPEKLQIIVASDASTDGTDEVVKSYATKGIQLVRTPEHRGKEFAQKLAVSAALGEILVFSDVATILKQDALKKIVANFADPSVACVSSEDKIISQDGQISGETHYVKYEMWLRRQESQVNSLVGLSGSYFAARKEVCQLWREDLPSDFNTVLNAMRLGMRAVSDSEVIGYYRAVVSERQEFKRKVRTVLRGLHVFFSSLEFLNPFRYGLFTLELLSHKLFRWLVPFALILVFISNSLFISKNLFYAGLFISQIAFYLVALIAILRRELARRIIFKLPLFFTLVNLSILVAWIHYFQGRKIVSWQPSKR